MTWVRVWLWLGVRLDASLGMIRQTTAPICERAPEQGCIHQYYQAMLPAEVNL